MKYQFVRCFDAQDPLSSCSVPKVHLIHLTCGLNRFYKRQDKTISPRHVTCCLDLVLVRLRSIHNTLHPSIPLATLQLTRLAIPKRNNQLAKLARILHIIKQRINLLDIEAMNAATDNRLQLLLAHKLNHFCKLLARAHGRAADFDVAQHGAHEEVHLR